MTETFSTSRKSRNIQHIDFLDSSERTQLKRLFKETRLRCRTCVNIEQDSHLSRSTSAVAISLRKLQSILNSNLLEELLFLHNISRDYDFGNVRANGIRSFVLITSRCLTSILSQLRMLNTFSFSRWPGTTERLLASYTDCLGELQSCIRLLQELPRFSQPGTLFPYPALSNLPEVGQCPIIDHSNATSAIQHDDDAGASNAAPDTHLARKLEFRNLQSRFDRLRQECFYGDCLAFYFCPSARRILLILGSLMAGFGSSFLASRKGLSSLMHTVFRSVTSYLSPGDRGVILARLTRCASIQFCKKFWSLAEHRVVSIVPSVMLSPVAIAHTFDLLPRDLCMPVSDGQLDYITVPYPIPSPGDERLSVRLLSYRSRPGCEWAQPNMLASLLQSTSLSPRFDDSGFTVCQFDHSHDDCRWKPSSITASGGGHVRAASFGGTVVRGEEEVLPGAGGGFLGDHTGRRLFSLPVDDDNGGGGNDVTGNSVVAPSSTLSPYLLVHIHGGGFVALNASSQDIFLRTWAQQLDCPIFSINYSLAPEAPYPRALDECYFAYCWATLNLERLGARRDARIVLSGDSAGGNLVLGVCLRAAHERIVPQPAGALVAYAPTVIAFVPAPSRMLSLTDPLLPIGILSKCLLAYAGVNEKVISAASTPRNSESDEDLPGSSSQLSPGSNTPTRKDSFTAQLFSRLIHLSYWPSSTGAPPMVGRGGKRARTSKMGRSVSVDSSSFYTNRSTSATSIPNNLYALADELSSEGLSNDRSFSNAVRDSPTDLDHARDIKFQQDAFLSPYLAPDSLLGQLPPLGIVCSNLDPFLDDCVELAKRAASLQVSVDLRVLDDLPHAFLNFAPLGPELQYANRVCISMLKDLFQKNQLSP